MFLLGTGKARSASDLVLHGLSWLASKHAKFFAKPKYRDHYQDQCQWVMHC
jgi:hypothetical protein